MGMRLPAALLARWRKMTCRCGHSQAAHAHYSSRTFCAFCLDCLTFSRDWRSLRRPRAHGL